MLLNHKDQERIDEMCEALDVSCRNERSREIVTNLVYNVGKKLWDYGEKEGLTPEEIYCVTCILNDSFALTLDKFEELQEKGII